MHLTKVFCFYRNGIPFYFFAYIFILFLSYCFNEYICVGGQNKAAWEDVTGSTPLTFVKDCVSFTTTVSARFWLMDCRNVSDAARMATELYTQVFSF